MAPLGKHHRRRETRSRSGQADGDRERLGLHPAHLLRAALPDRRRGGDRVRDPGRVERWSSHDAHQVMRPARPPLEGCGQRGRPVRASALRKARVATLSASGWVSTAVRNAASLASSATKRIPGAAKRSVTVSGSRAKPAPAATAGSTCSTRGSASLRTSARVRRYGLWHIATIALRNLGWPPGEARPAGPAPAARGRSPR